MPITCRLSFLKLIESGNLNNPIEIANTLIDIEINLFQQFEKLLSEFIRKQDRRFRDESPGPEAKANYLALNMLVGIRGLYYYSRKAYSGLEP